jgi:Rrf2 family protein
MISKKTKYALKALITLTESYLHQKPILISDLAVKDAIPRKFLELILLELKNKGVLLSKKGKGGGYFLAKPPKGIMLGEVMRILEGPLAPLPCLSKSAYHKCEECRDEQHCGIRIVMKDVYEAQTRILDQTSLQDMIDRACKTKQTEMYYI